MANLRNVYMINYYPINNNSKAMWTNYNGALYQSDMVVAKNMGFNTLRVFLSTAVFDYPNPTGSELAKLTDFYNRAKTVGIKLHITLFDSFFSYGQIGGSLTWTAAILNALPDTTVVQAIELQNETQFSSSSSYTLGFDSGWPSGATQYSTVGPVAIVWAQQLIPYIRTALPGVPVVPSTTNYNQLLDLQAIVTALKGTAAEPDWYEWHCYAQEYAIYPQLAGALAIVGDPAKLFIGETGYSSGATATISAAQGSQIESEYIQTVRWVCQQLNLPEPAPWILYDLNPNPNGFTTGQTNGLLDVNGNPKPAGIMYANLPPGSPIPSLSINAENASTSVDVYGNTLPARWTVNKGGTGTQPIQTVVDYTTLFLGKPTILATGSGGSSGSDSPPALQSWPLGFPVINPGQSYTFSVFLKASGSYGTPQLDIAWYSLSAYISGSGSSLLTLTSSFTKYTVTGVAPVGAASAMLYVRTSYNAGNIWIGGATWTGQSPRLVTSNGSWYRK